MSGPVCFVTGGGRNLGRQLCLSMAGAGYDIALTYLSDRSAADAVAAEVQALGRSALVLAADVASSGDAERAISSTLERYGRLDAVVNNAAVRARRPLAELADDDWNHAMAVNLSGPFFTSRAAAPAMTAAAGGSLIHISGLIAFQGGGGGGAHIAAGKAGLLGLSRALADELGPAGIRSNVVVAGRMDTVRPHAVDPDKVAAEVAATPLRRVGTVLDVAEMCVFLASQEAQFVTGQVLHVNGGFFKG